MIEHQAFNHGWRGSARARWELPFVAFQARLAGTERVLDVSTGDGSRLAERLRLLYPRVRYRTGNGGTDEVHDRILGVRTLEGVPAARRDARLARIAHALAPGGLFVTTWRPDPGDPWELSELGTRHGLRPLDEAAGSPAGTRGATLYKPPAPALPARRRILLGLLTWNTRDVSLESRAACVREAEMLRRLGHDPCLVVCDNGSTDGTREALAGLDGELAVPHRFLLNERNRGSSVARNQILDVFRELDGDALLFVDGDIELVPFSSFAMLRHLEDAPPEVGCVGAHCHDQTRERAEATPYLFSVGDHRVADDRDDLWVAWTQYGLFRREVFDAGVRFDTRPPFDRPGWGCEDVDLAFQMHRRGFYSQAFKGMTYLHRNLNSSIPFLRELGTDPAAEYDLRRRYVIEKWRDAGLGEKTLDFLREAAPRF